MLLSTVTVLVIFAICDTSLAVILKNFKHEQLVDFFPRNDDVISLDFLQKSGIP
jgi:hypothetical protein